MGYCNSLKFLSLIVNKYFVSVISDIQLLFDMYSISYLAKNIKIAAGDYIRSYIF